jgi:hypothetical protein
MSMKISLGCGQEETEWRGDSEPRFSSVFSAVSDLQQVDSQRVAVPHAFESDQNLALDFVCMTFVNRSPRLLQLKE